MLPSCFFCSSLSALVSLLLPHCSLILCNCLKLNGGRLWETRLLSEKTDRCRLGIQLVLDGDAMRSLREMCNFVSFWKLWYRNWTGSKVFVWSLRAIGGERKQFLLLWLGFVVKFPSDCHRCIRFLKVQLGQLLLYIRDHKAECRHWWAHSPLFFFNKKHKTKKKQQKQNRASENSSLSQ